jgi:hypothetical protein
VGFNLSIQDDDTPHKCVEGFARLWREHHERLKESAISDAIIASRGYFSVENRAEAKRIGFPGLGSGLGIPLHTVFGRVTIQYKPDAPRVNAKGRPRKYENLAGRAPCLDIHPSQLHMVGDPSIRVLIGEGIFKGDALVSAGAFAINTTGTGNWRGRNQFGCPTALPDWEKVAIKGREFIL